MTIRQVRVGSMVDIHQYDDADHDSAIETDQPIKAGSPVDPTDVLRRVDIGTIAGDVTGPASSTDNAIARFDGATGKVLQNSSVLIDDSGHVGIGASPISDSQILVSGSFTGTVGAAAPLTITSSITSLAGNNVYGAVIAPTLINSSGVGGNFAGLFLATPTVTITAGSVTDASTLLIQGAPTAGTNVWSIRVIAGNAYLGAGLTVAGLAGTGSRAVVADANGVLSAP